MSSPSFPLQSSNISDYLYITLFMLTYRFGPNRSFNALLFNQLSSLNNLLERSSITLKTIALFRKELVGIINDIFFPETSLTPDDSIDLCILITSLTAHFDLEIPESFYESIIDVQPIIAEDLLFLKDPCVDFFRSIASFDLRIYQSDFRVFLFLLVDFLQKLYLPDLPDSFMLIKTAIISQFCEHNFSVHSLPPSTVPTFNKNIGISSSPIGSLPPELIDLVSRTKNFIVIEDPFHILQFGSSAHLFPSFELQLRKIFPSSPPAWYSQLISELISLPILYGTSSAKKDDIIADLRQLLKKYQKLLQDSSDSAQAPA